MAGRSRLNVTLYLYWFSCHSDIKQLSVAPKQHIYLYRVSLTIKLYYFCTCTESISFFETEALSVLCQARIESLYKI